jgi:hypothetical protein
MRLPPAVLTTLSLALLLISHHSRPVAHAHSPQSAGTSPVYVAAGTGDLAYAAYTYCVDIYCGGGVSVVPIQDGIPAPPIASYPAAGWVYDLIVHGDYLYLAWGDFWRGYAGGLEVVDISNPAALTLVATRNLIGRAYDLDITGNTLYLAWGVDNNYQLPPAGGVEIIDISQPAAPVLLGRYDLPQKITSVAVANQHAYLVDSDQNIRVLNVNQPAEPFAVSFYDPLWPAQRVAAAGRYLYAAAGEGGLWIIDTIDPSALNPIGHFETTDEVLDVAIVGNYAYLADGEAGLRILDLTLPAEPVETGHYDLPGTSLRVTTSGATAYIAAGSEGLFVLQPLSLAEKHYLPFLLRGNTP